MRHEERLRRLAGNTNEADAQPTESQAAEPVELEIKEGESALDALNRYERSVILGGRDNPANTTLATGETFEAYQERTRSAQEAEGRAATRAAAKSMRAAHTKSEPLYEGPGAMIPVVDEAGTARIVGETRSTTGEGPTPAKPDAEGDEGLQGDRQGGQGDKTGGDGSGVNNEQ